MPMYDVRPVLFTAIRNATSVVRRLHVAGFKGVANSAENSLGMVRYTVENLPPVKIEAETMRDIAKRLRTTIAVVSLKISRNNAKHDRPRITPWWEDAKGTKFYPPRLFSESQKHPHGNHGKRRSKGR